MYVYPVCPLFWLLLWSGLFSLFFFFFFPSFFKVMERWEKRGISFSSSPPSPPPPPCVSSAGSVKGAHPGEVRTNRVERKETRASPAQRWREETDGERENEGGGRDEVRGVVTTVTTLCFTPFFKIDFFFF